MKPLKCFAWKVWCLWNGCEPTTGTYYSATYGRHLPCICCKHCHKLMVRL